MFLSRFISVKLIFSTIILLQNVKADTPANVCPISLVCVYDECLCSFSNNITASLLFCNIYQDPVQTELLSTPSFASDWPESQIVSACECLIAASGEASPNFNTSVSAITGLTPGNLAYVTISGYPSPSQTPAQNQTTAFEANITPATDCPSPTPVGSVPQLVPLNGTDVLIGYPGNGSDLYFQFPQEDEFRLAVTNTSLTIRNATSGDIGVNVMGELFYTPPDCFATFIFRFPSNDSTSNSGADRKSKKFRRADDSAPTLISVHFELVDDDNDPNTCTNPVLLCHNEGELQSADFETLSPGNYLGSCPFSALADLNDCVRNVGPLLQAVKDVLTILDSLEVRTVLLEEGSTTFCGAAFVAAGESLGFSAAFLDEALALVVTNPAFTFVGGAAIIALYGACIYEYNKLTSLLNLLETMFGFNVDKILESQSTAQDLCEALSKYDSYEIDVLDASNNDVIFQTTLLGFATTSIEVDPVYVPNTCSSTASSMPSSTSEISMTPTTNDEPTTAAATSAMPSSSLKCGIQEGYLCDLADVGPACCDSGLVCDSFCVPQCDAPGVNCDHIPEICMTQCGAQNAPGTVFDD